MQKKTKTAKKKVTPAKKTAVKKATKKAIKKVVKKVAPKKATVKKTVKKAVKKAGSLKKKVTKKINPRTLITMEDLFGAMGSDLPRKKEEVDFDALFDELFDDETTPYEETPPQKDNNTELNELFAQLFGDLDETNPKDAFDMVDTNKDGVISKQEMKVAAGPEASRITLEDLFGDIDANKDNKITLEELFGYIEEKEKTTPAYSSILHPAQDEIQDDEVFVYHQEWYQKAAFSLGVALVALVIGGMWYQVTRGHFQTLQESTQTGIHKAQEAVDQQSKFFRDAKGEIDTLIKNAQ